MQRLFDFHANNWQSRRHLFSNDYRLHFGFFAIRSCSFSPSEISIEIYGPKKRLLYISGVLRGISRMGTTMKAKRIIAALVFVVAVVSVWAADAQWSADPRVTDLVQSGKLRVALGLGSPVLAMKDANTDQVRGPALDLAQALAKKIGVKLEPVEYPRPGAILAGLKNNEWDVTFLVADPARLADADFSPPYMQSDFTYLVPAGSSKRSVADMDQPGV